MNRRFLALLAFSLWTVCASAQFVPSLQPGVKLHGRTYAELFAAQKLLLSNYSRLDFEGARLQPQGWERIKPFTTIKDNPDFDRVIVVTRFQVDETESPSEIANVTYQIVGYFDRNEGYRAQIGTSHAAFRVREERGQLVITELQPLWPHVSPRAALAWIKAQLADPKISDVTRDQMKLALPELEKLTSPAHPSPAAQ